jgi:flavodoxin
MKTLIVYLSKFGNTRRLAEAVTAVTKQAGEAHLISMDQLAASSFEGVDLVVMATPTHGFAVPQEVRSVLGSLPRGILAGKSVAAFDTTVKPWPLRLMRASPKLLRQLRGLGGKPVAPPQTFYVQTRNPQKTSEIDLLLEGEIDRARQWAGKIVEQSATVVQEK